MKIRRFPMWALLFLLLASLPAEEGPQVIGLREQAAVIDSWLLKRLEMVLPAIMRRESIDMWLVICREYNEDPVYLTLTPAATMSARRLSMLLFFDRGGEGIERAVIARYGIEPYYKALWDPAKNDQWECLARAVRERNPRRIGINEGTTFAFGDGLTSTLKQKLVRALGDVYAGRLVSAERLAVGWLEKRLDEEIEAYPRIVSIARRIIREVLSHECITPGVTTTTDLVWAFRDRIEKLGLEPWFQPAVDVQRPGSSDREAGMEAVIRPGDLLHCDLGIRYLRLCTDTQEMAYVLKPGENDAPPGMKKALALGNRLQDILAAEFKAGRSGNEVLLSALERMKEQGLKGAIYTHPLGYHGHAAGPTIGLWDKQQAISGDGDYLLYPGTCYSIELNVKVPLAEWQDQEVRMGLEEDAFFAGDRFIFLDGRQEELILIR